MKIKALILSVLVIGCMSGLFAFSPINNNSNMIQQAIQSNDTPQLIKSLITEMKDQLEKDQDNYPSLIAEVENYTKKCSDSASKAILHSMIAEMYNSYYQQNRWTIDRRTPISGYIPEDIREWTSNLFTDKITSEIRLSLQPDDILQKKAISSYKDILQEGTDSRELRPTLYDFLAYRAIELQPSDSIYKALVSFRKTQPNKKAALLTELDYLKYMYGSVHSQNNTSAYQKALDSLFARFSHNELSVEIAIAQLSLLRSVEYTNADSIKAIQYQLCKDMIAKYPNYERIGSIQNHLQNMERPSLSVQTNNTVYPGKELKLQLSYTNIPAVHIRIYRSLKKVEETFINSNPNENTANTFGKLVTEITVPLSLKNSYTQEDTTVSVAMAENGLYEYVIEANNKEVKVQNLFSVTKLAALHRYLPSGEREILVTDYQTGKPIHNADIRYYGENRRMPQLVGSVKTDVNGIAVLPQQENIYGYRASLPGDTSALGTYQSYSSTNPSAAFNEAPSMLLLTDRGLYRPGQTIFFKGIVYNGKESNPFVIADKAVTIVLRDANYKEITTKQLKTNKFGSFNGEFILPKQGLTGTFFITTENATITVQVEEYKRPTFAIKIEPIKEEVAFGDNVTIQGKAQTFSGVAVQNAEVSYRIVRHPFWLRPYMGSRISKQVAEGKTVLNNDGTFALSFRPEKEENRVFPAFQTYEVIAQITDSKGETQETSFTFSVGDQGFVLSTNLSNRVDKENTEIVIGAQTINGESTSTNGTYTLVELKETDKENVFAEGKTLVKGNFTTDKTLNKAVLSKLTSGRARLYLEAKDSKGRKVDFQQDIILYSKTDKRPPVFTHTWLLNNKTSCLPGENAEFTFGTSDKNAFILYELFTNNTRIELKRIELTNENRTFKIPYADSYGDNLMASFTFVKEGQLYTTQTTISRRYPNRTLTIKPETFRDRLLPGTKETWTFRILDADSQPVNAEVLAGMYDASLDKILPFNWDKFSLSSNYQYIRPFSTSNGFGMRHNNSSASFTSIKEKSYEFDRLDWQGMMDMRRYSYGSGIYLKSTRTAGVQNMEVMDQSMPVPAAEEAAKASPEQAVIMQPEAQQSGPSALRTNFNETAFFFPILQTDKEGNVVVSFTIPESNTTWKFQTIAQTADLKQGYLSKEVITQKPVMVLPNLPRFLRQGDEISISTQLLNQSEKAINGLVRLELFDPATEQPVVCLTKSQRPFELEAGKNGSASWTIPVPATIDLIGVRIIAESDAGNDGEQHLIPVLTNNILITESTPFYLAKTGEKVIQIPENKSTTSNPYRLTLELSSNPVWYAVQALPTITLPENDNILSWFAAYYGNTLAQYIIQAHPRIKNIIDQWNAQGGDASSLLSNLEKNEELKNILLTETPWVLEAKNETEQKQRLSLLFDVNRAAQQRETALQVLLDGQNEDGSWGWFKGLYPNRDITISILKGMTQLIQLNAIQYNQQEKEMQIRALNYLDKSIQKEYELSKKEGLPSSGQIDYLFMRSNYRDIPEWGDAREAIRFYTNQAEKHWKKASLYEKGEIAWLMNQNGKKGVSKDILNRLRKNATSSNEKGMYWANNRRGSSFYVSPIDVHCLLMSVFNELSPNTTETDLMKQWLLNQKRTQNWESVPATVNAIYAILLTGSNWLDENNTVSVQWGKQTIHSSAGEVATGYIKQALTNNEITPESYKVTVKKEGNAPAWGAVYNQYFEAIDKVTGQKGSLNVDKKLFIETNSGTEQQIQPVTSERGLRVGDKVIVRLTIRTDQEMHYVYLKDLRAACFEPANQVSGTTYRDGLVYYQAPKDISENFFFDRLPKGTFVLEYAVYVSRTGEYAGGISSIQCLYAPEFVSHTSGERLVVKE